VCIEQEPYSLSTFQILSLKKLYGFKAVLLSSQNLYKKYPPPFSWIEAFCLKKIDLFLAVSSSVVPVWVKKGFDPIKIKVLPQVGINPKEFRPLPNMKEKFGVKGFAFGYAGRFVEEKGIQVLLQAFSKLDGIVGAQLVLIGRGPYKSELDLLIQKLNLIDKVLFLDGIRHHEMPEILNALDVLVLPSLIRPHWKEQFGHILIEAQACGVPVIGSDYEPIPETLGLGGASFHTGSAEDLAKWMNRLMLDRAFYNELSQKARLNVETRFTNEAVATRLLALLQSLSF
jgi:glycosyltransferase involved in cell wall biosynthesis